MLLHLAVADMQLKMNKLRSTLVIISVSDGLTCTSGILPGTTALLKDK